MKTTRYLYGIEPQFLKNLNYEQAIKFKIERAKELLNELVHIKNEAFTKRVEDIQNAIEFNKNLLQEIE